MRIARAMWAAVLAVCLEIPDVVAQECGSSSDQKVGLRSCCCRRWALTESPSASSTGLQVLNFGKNQIVDGLQVLEDLKKRRCNVYKVMNRINTAEVLRCWVAGFVFWSVT